MSGAIFVASDAPKSHAREKGCGPGGDGNPEREVGEREQRDSEEGGEEGVDRVAAGGQRPEPAAGKKAHEQRASRGRGSERGGHSGLGPEGDGLAVRVVEVRRAAPVHEMACGALLGREPRRDEAIRERPRAGAKKRPRADHFPPREEPDVALRRGGRKVTAAEIVEFQEEAASASGHDRKERCREEGEERERAPAEVERHEGRGTPAERERWRDGLGREETDERRQKTDRRKTSRPGARTRLRRSCEEEQRGDDERHPDVARVPDEARREKPGLRGFEGQPKEASPALERREGTGGGARRHQRDRRGGPDEGRLAWTRRRGGVRAGRGWRRP